VISVDLKAATITIRLGSTAEVAESIELTTRVANPRGAEDNLRDEAIRQLDDRVAERTEALRREITKKLEGKLHDIKQELDAAVGRATVAALTERAAQLGQIQDIAEDQAGNVTIRVKL
jgi:hypothetical protein